MNIPTPPTKETADYSGRADPPSVQIEIPFDLAGLRFDAALAKMLPEHSRSRLQDWIRDGRVSVGGQVVLDTKYKLIGGEQVTVAPVASNAELADVPEAIPLDIIFEDEHLIVINKPAGLVVHPGSGNWSGTLLNALLAHDESLAGLPRAGIVHRLDKETSGLMVVARTLTAQTDLVRQLQEHTVKRHYAALVLGKPNQVGFIDAPIGRHPNQRVKMAVVENGKPARTHFKVIEHFARCSQVECVLETGRTHQIRVHMAHIGHALVGDPVYGPKRQAIKAAVGFDRQALHAFRLGLTHPDSHQPVQWEVPLAEDLRALIAAVRTES
ncbi:23S rRNA pseudouridine(1911/1915/1917) synthase RluD [Uliginosibacterium sp. H3]|uniref:Pseudouridine synthase n=1 Tax=Uliginosibacterium silvisoli TaxID=3114758 RepID=A0ABU6K576_9RHOO|nr:23S rRNA pseudouridine(1911/1915/1917) synthase RluD [Uliginosibacterium sp. H3]